MNAPTIECFTKHNNRGHGVSISEFDAWRDPITGSQIFGPVVSYSWYVGPQPVRLNDPESRLSLRLVPDSTGLICFERGFRADNCLLLDAYGNERMRLSVPWELTGKPEPIKMWCRDISAPYVNAKTGESGKFGVTACLEYGGGPYEYHDYYFELEWRTGRFLWGKSIRY